MNKPLRIVLQALLAGAIVFGGMKMARRLVATAPEVARAKPQEVLREVVFQVTEAEDHAVRVYAHGVLQPAREVVLRPEVTGVVRQANPRLEPGQRVEKGEVLFEIDGRDYQLEVDRQVAARQQAQQNLELEEGRHRIAQKEWSLFKNDKGPVPRAPAATSDASRRLALRLPQLATARAAVASAKSGEQRARLALERTRIVSPFDGTVQAKYAELGELVSPQTDMVHLVGVHAAWIELPLTPRQLSRLRVPGVTGEAGATGMARAEIGGSTVARPAKVLHLLPQVDKEIRLARVLVEVQEPFDASYACGECGTDFPLLLGSYCQVELEGRPLEGVIPVPRVALHERSRVYLLDAEDRLRIRRVEPAWEEPDTVWVRAGSGLEPGERLIVSHLSSPIEGQRLRGIPASSGDAPEATARATPPVDATPEPEAPGEDEAAAEARS